MGVAKPTLTVSLVSMMQKSSSSLHEDQHKETVVVGQPRRQDP